MKTVQQAQAELYLMLKARDVANNALGAFENYGRNYRELPTPLAVVRAHLQRVSDTSVELLDGLTVEVSKLLKANPEPSIVDIITRKQNQIGEEIAKDNSEWRGTIEVELGAGSDEFFAAMMEADESEA